MRKFVLLSTVLFTTPFTMNMSYGQCVNTLDCQALGYNKTSCQNPGVKCPTGNYWYCPKDSICTYGDIYYSDKTCSKEYISFKTPIAVVVYDENGEKWVMSLDIAGGGTWAFSERADLPEITNYATAEEAATDLKSCENTTAIFNFVKGEFEYEARYSASDIAKNYAPSGATNTKGKWCLPAAGIWNMVSKHRTEIDGAISRAGGAPFKSPSYYWSSSEKDSQQVWSWYSGKNILYSSIKVHDTTNAVRPVMRIK